MPAPISLELKYTNRQPVALKDLTNSLDSFAAEYKRIQKRTSTTFEQDKAELYITSIREGSIIADLMPLAAAGVTLIESSNTVIEFCTHLKTGFGYLLGKVGRWPNPEKKSVENLMKIVEPIARENGTQIHITAPITLGDGATMNIIINTGQAQQVRETGKALIQRLDAPRTGTTDNVKLYWYQARNEKASNAGDRAIIPEIWEKPVKIRFSTDAIKERMLADDDNLFKMVYTVDVIADFKGRKPTHFTIVKVRSVKHQ